MFPISIGFISRLHLVKSQKKAFEKWKQNLENDWIILLSITFKQTSQICDWLVPRVARSYTPSCLNQTLWFFRAVTSHFCLSYHLFAFFIHKESWLVVGIHRKLKPTIKKKRSLLAADKMDGWYIRVEIRAIQLLCTVVSHASTWHIYDRLHVMADVNRPRLKQNVMCDGWKSVHPKG